MYQRLARHLFHDLAAGKYALGDRLPAEREFHFAIARATRNAVVVRTIEDMWNLRAASPECALLLNKARNAKIRPVVAEHAAIVEALRARDPAAARGNAGASRRCHGPPSFTTEEQAVEEARRSFVEKSARYAPLDINMT